MKLATLKSWTALGVNDVSGRGPLGTPPPALSAVAWERRAGGAFAPGFDEAAGCGTADCSEEVDLGPTLDAVALGLVDNVVGCLAGAAQQRDANKRKTKTRLELMKLMTKEMIYG